MSDVDENNEFCLAEDRFEDMQHNVSDRENFEFDCLTRDQVKKCLMGHLHECKNLTIFVFL